MLAVTGKALIKLLLADEGYTIWRVNTHGTILGKWVDGRMYRTTIKDNREDIPPGTLAAILGPKQTGLGRAWLERKLAARKK